MNAPKYVPFTKLQCRVNGNGYQLHFQWLKNDKPLNVHPPSSSLLLRYPTQKDSGSYKCVAFNEGLDPNKFGRVESLPLHVEIYNSCNDTHATFMCNLKNVNTSPLEKTLMCRYENSARFHRKRSASESGSQLLSTSKRKKIAVAENDSATISCDVSRFERKMNQVSVHWKKDGKLIRQSMLNEPNTDMSMANPIEYPQFRDDGRIIMDSKNGSITITSTIPSDSGIFEVRSSNSIQQIPIIEKHSLCFECLF